MSRKSVLLLLLAGMSLLCSCTSTPRIKTEPDVVFITTPHRVVREMLKLAELRKEDVLYDLGSGDGRIVIAGARDFGARAVGIEIDEKLLAESAENARMAGVSERTSFRKGDIFATDIHEATVVTLFLLPGVNRMLIPKLYKDLEPGTRIVSHRFDMGDWKPDLSLSGYGSDVYFWLIPANVEGDWNITVYREKEPWKQTWRFHQAYQVVRGTDPATNALFKDIRIYGRDIEMSVENSSMGFGSEMELRGQVDGDTMEGTATLKGSRSAGEYKWKGTRARNDSHSGKKK